MAGCVLNFWVQKNWSTFRSQPNLSKPYSMTCPITFQYILSTIMYTPSTSSGLVVKTRQIAWLNAAARCHPQAPFLTASATPSSAKVALKFQLELVDWPWGKHTKNVENHGKPMGKLLQTENDSYCTFMVGLPHLSVCLQEGK